MKALLLSTLAILSVQPADGFERIPGQRFPQVVLPSIRDGEAIDLKDHFGEKMMLHLFASW